MEQLCLHGLLVQLYAKHLLAEGKIPPVPGTKGFGAADKQSATPADEVRAPVWLGKDYQLQFQPTATAYTTKASWQRGHWRSLSPLVGGNGWQPGPLGTPRQW